MTTDMKTTGLIVVIIAGITVLSLLFFLLAIYGLLLTDKQGRSKLGTSLGHTVGPLGIFLVSLIPFFVNRLINGPGQPLPNEAADTGVRLVMAVTIIWSLVGGSIALPIILKRLRGDDPRYAKDERDKRQDNQQLILDETSLDLTQRGHHYTRAGLNLDKRRLGMDAEQRDMDTQRHSLDDRENELK